MTKKFFDSQQAEDQATSNDSTYPQRLHAPATQRNKEFILHTLQEHLPNDGTILELACGTGQHACHFAQNMPTIIWQPTDIEQSHLDSVKAWAAYLNIDNIAPARYLNVLDGRPEWDMTPSVTAICAINLIHIAPFAVTQSLFAMAGKMLSESHHTLYLYGPYKRNGDHTSPSNFDFDDSLKAQNPDWGIRDMETVIKLGEQAGFRQHQIIPMPANNFSLIFKK